MITSRGQCDWSVGLVSFFAPPSTPQSPSMRKSIVAGHPCRERSLLRSLNRTPLDRVNESVPGILNVLPEATSMEGYNGGLESNEVEGWSVRVGVRCRESEVLEERVGPLPPRRTPLVIAK